MALPPRLRIALAHLAPSVGDLDHNRALLERATIFSAEAGADWIVTGELVVCGYGFVDRIGTDWIEPQPGPWLSSYARLSASLNVATFVSHPERDAISGLLYNTMFAIGQNGQLLGRHRKLHPTPESESWSSPGHAIEPVIIDNTRVGLLVCADAYPPAPAQKLREQGAEIIVSAAAWWPGEWGPHGEWEQRTRETGIPMIVCNRTGVDAEHDLRGGESTIVDKGERVLTVSSDVSTIFLLDCQFRDGHILDCILSTIEM